MHTKIEKIYIVDLDNTLYNTWPTLIKSSRRSYLKYFYFSEVYRNLTLPKFDKLLELIKKRFSRNHILFLTARHKVHYLPTLLKLIHDLGWGGWRLKLVKDAHSKVPVIKNMLKKYKTVIVIDDLSFNHEIGVISVYQQVIQDISKTNAKLITGNRLKRLQ
jgi:hypothetical protein